MKSEHFSRKDRGSRMKVGRVTRERSMPLFNCLIIPSRILFGASSSFSSYSGSSPATTSSEDIAKAQASFLHSSTNPPATRQSLLEAVPLLLHLVNRRQAENGLCAPEAVIQSRGEHLPVETRCPVTFREESFRNVCSPPDRKGHQIGGFCSFLLSMVKVFGKIGRRVWRFGRARARSSRWSPVETPKTSSSVSVSRPASAETVLCQTMNHLDTPIPHQCGSFLCCQRS